ncbi:kinesin-like protein KIF6 isoform X5 [Hydra vulgaris]|uniref:kinesin-like protein KIF6 isoform X5 n=1 Tax=Hydra vulgaris TaxID=6087 RepID=UPI001F5EE5D8|nr:kinesin-like protein KIF6 isoform X5 [Hydra vulgaris]
MVKQTIQIFCRIKPTKQSPGLYEVKSTDTLKNEIFFYLPHGVSDGYINNKKENYIFLFDQVFDQKSVQDEVFLGVAFPVIKNVLCGYNGTIFAYGQTGSGKTFTITGGAERYVDRGIIPRTLSYIFKHQLETPSLTYTTHVSYLEIYNETGYDLLHPNHDGTKLEDLPKVSLLEDNDGNIHLKNLSVNQAFNEEEALNLLFLGDTNRMIAETPMNQASTRSHCIFSIHLTIKEQNSPTIRKSKLHLVDLAGSERVSKTGVCGTLLKEAKYINLSLHYLEQVIIALSDKSRNHIPYRNSMMTAVLRDSLGGNCMTSMIATISIDKNNIDESISTCRFAQRVALIKNNAFLNEELDPKLLIMKLKQEILDLKNELYLLTGADYNSNLTEEEKLKLQQLITDYLNNTDKDSYLSVGADMRKINFSFMHLKGTKEKNIIAVNHVKKLSIDKQEEFERFQKTYFDNPAIEEKKKGLKIRYSDAKKLGEQVNKSRININLLKSKIERKKDPIQNGQEIHQNKSFESDDQNLREALEKEKILYKRSFNGLKALKNEIEHMQHLLETSKVKLHQDFELWWTQQTSEYQNEIKNTNNELSSFIETASSQKNKSHSLSLNSEMQIGLKKSDLSNENDGKQIKADNTKVSSTIQLTGDIQTDKDILQFMQARQDCLQREMRSGKSCQPQTGSKKMTN